MFFYDGGDRLRAIWIPVFAHLLVWTACLFLEYFIAGWDAWTESVESPRRRGDSILRYETARSAARGPQSTGPRESLDERSRLLSGDEGPDTERISPQTDRLRRAAQAARTTFLMLLSAVVFVSLPIAGMCEEPTLPNLPPKCRKCIVNGITDATPILVWTFFGLSGVWVVLELFSSASSRAGTSLMRALMGLIVGPVAIAIWATGIVRWADLKAMEGRCG
ncbi:hypothetical protein M427DRAFT_67704 [Gonapodya prolifera JEL478]|uniref:Uncharacterized protein n=1 Tax=Gonapodya prolifera (strain JEL478) TaxID=1344416 RepID=A0A139APP9_GONPJ|nr:hypothetical protein M427DRAFT_67704 [Gonapodya prolifera JEL478]|eukprot:KXS18702.1 hypothetical protein M427DRAFT_67704 [Gonapodya prolifera JEL478]